MRFSFILAMLTVSAVTLNACSNSDPEALLPDLAPSGATGAAGKFIAPSGEEIGHAILYDAQQGDRAGVILRVDVAGLSQGWHGIHIHGNGDCSDGADGFKESGGHVDPDNRDHGLSNQDGAERGDLPNLYAGSDGRATAEYFRADVNIAPSEEAAAVNGPYPLFDDNGFAIIIHAAADDHASQPIGGAGGRVACAAFNQ